MTGEELHRAAMSLPAATMDVQWGDDHVNKVGGKMFAATDAAGRNLSFKATDIAFEALIEAGRARPAPYMARAKWVFFDDVTALDAGEVEGWLRTAYELVAAKLTRKARADLGLT